MVLTKDANPWDLATLISLQVLDISYIDMCNTQLPSQISALFTHANYLGTKSDHKNL